MLMSSISTLLKEQMQMRFSLEVLPPLRGSNSDKIFNTIEHLLPYKPLFVSVTSHRSDFIYKELHPGVFTRVEERMRPGTVAIAYAIKQKYGLPVVPHIICSGYSQTDTENELIDLALLNMTDILVLRGDKAKQDNRFVPSIGGLAHASELCEQVNRFNNGDLLYGDKHQFGSPFHYGVAGYPEKHEEAMNLQTDMDALKRKVDLGAEFILTQMCFDCGRFLDFVERCRAAGIHVPILPGIKPLGTLSHLTVLPSTFHVDFPDALAKRLRVCQTNEDVKKVGIEWAIEQAATYKAAGLPCVHFYTMNNSPSVEQIVKAAGLTDN